MYITFTCTNEDGQEVTLSDTGEHLQPWPVIIKRVAMALEAYGFINVQEHLQVVGTVDNGKLIKDIEADYDE